MSESHDQWSDHRRTPLSYRFENPRSIRALAHQARLAIIDALATGEELTATQCALADRPEPSVMASTSTIW